MTGWRQIPMFLALMSAPVAQTQVPLAQKIPPAPVESPGAPAIAIHLPALTMNLDLIGGRFVRVRDVRIDDTISPQRFIVRAPGWRNTRAVVLLSRAPAREFAEDMAIEIWGRAYTVGAAHLITGWPPELDDDAVDEYRRMPIIAAEGIRTIDGVDLYRQAP